ncbi:hypothetical protein EYC84_010865 [Monilinia fructicola]|uniref:Uncharacterized protein n=1 Tax=Monilinia fructicola TaxID=38448 RepID=A0A5M9JBS9_MONFR|nr:hypothetical protein EYC84_010865 [Monilinia fructicola]
MERESIDLRYAIDWCRGDEKTGYQNVLQRRRDAENWTRRYMGLLYWGSISDADEGIASLRFVPSGLHDDSMLHDANTYEVLTQQILTETTNRCAFLGFRSTTSITSRPCVQQCRQHPSQSNQRRSSRAESKKNRCSECKSDLGFWAVVGRGEPTKISQTQHVIQTIAGGGGLLIRSIHLWMYVVESLGK